MGWKLYPLINPSCACSVSTAQLHPYYQLSNPTTTTVFPAGKNKIVTKNKNNRMERTVYRCMDAYCILCRLHVLYIPHLPGYLISIVQLVLTHYNYTTVSQERRTKRKRKDEEGGKDEEEEEDIEITWCYLTPPAPTGRHMHVFPQQRKETK